MNYVEHTGYNGKIQVDFGPAQLSDLLHADEAMIRDRLGRWELERRRVIREARRMDGDDLTHARQLICGFTALMRSFRSRLSTPTMTLAETTAARVRSMRYETRAHRYRVLPTETTTAQSTARGDHG